MGFFDNDNGHFAKREAVDRLYSRIDKQEKEIKELRWRVENPPKYRVGQKTKHGVCTGLSVEDRLILPKGCGAGLISYHGLKTVYCYEFIRGEEHIKVYDE